MRPLERDLVVGVVGRRLHGGAVVRHRLIEIARLHRLVARRNARPAVQLAATSVAATITMSLFSSLLTVPQISRPCISSEL